MKENEFLDGVSHLEPDVVERFVSMDNRLRRKAERPKALRIFVRVGTLSASLAVILCALLVMPLFFKDIPGIRFPSISLPHPHEPISPDRPPYGDATPDLLNHTFSFDSYPDMIRGFRQSGVSVGSYTIREMKPLLGEPYASFVDRVNQDGSFPQPTWRGSPLPYQNMEGFSNITFFVRELYNMPWVWYHCLVEGERVNIQITYPACLGMEVDPSKDASEMLKAIAPNAVNTDNYRDRPAYEAVYLQSIPMAAGDTGVLVYELKDSDKILYTFFQGDMMVTVTDFQGVITHPFWKSFALETLGEVAQDNDLLRGSDVISASVTSLPGGYAYAFGGDNAQAIAEYLSGLTLIDSYSEKVDEYAGMTWIISLTYADGGIETVYHFGNLFIRTDGGSWYKMEYGEAARFQELLDELNSG